MLGVQYQGNFVGTYQWKGEELPFWLQTVQEARFELSLFKQR